MRNLSLNKTGLNKIRSSQTELRAGDLEDSIKSVAPGEWCLLTSSSAEEVWPCFINPMVDEKYTAVYVVDQITKKEIQSFSPEEFIKSKIDKAYRRRLRFEGYENGARIFYGSGDGLPGLIVDKFINTSIVQINTAGLDKFRELIRDFVGDVTKTKAILLDNQKYREKESLPVFEKDEVPDLEIEENGIRFHLRSEVIQKVGFYYDHRENRRQLMALLDRIKKPTVGVDLFCYAGAWGLSALKAGTEKIVFVDQGNFSSEVEDALSRNGFSGRGEFQRIDVFKFLDKSINENTHFDLILCDPPAFAKSLSQKKDALDGYSKLHRRVLKLATPGALLAFSSCTHYVSHEEFQKNILDAASKEGKKLQLLYSGLQGWDHPITSQNDKSNYIKSYFYLLES